MKIVNYGYKTAFGSLPWTKNDSEQFQKALNENAVIFNDVDTQNDFMMPNSQNSSRKGLLVPNSENILLSLKKITDSAKRFNIPVVASMDTHSTNDPEFEYFKDISDGHCVKNTPGWKKIFVTQLDNPRVISVEQDVNDVPARSEIKKFINGQGKPVIIEKNTLDVFKYVNSDKQIEDNPKSIKFYNELKNMGVKFAVVYGVATDFCVKAAVRGLKMIGIKPIVVEDAVKHVINDDLHDQQDVVYKDVTVITVEQLENELKKSVKNQ